MNIEFNWIALDMNKHFGYVDGQGTKNSGLFKTLGLEWSTIKSQAVDPNIFRMFIKGRFDAYVLSPLTKTLFLVSLHNCWFNLHPEK